MTSKKFQLSQEKNVHELHISVHYLMIQATHLVHMVARWYGCRIYANCRQKLFLSDHDTGERTLLVTFLVEQKRD